MTASNAGLLMGAACDEQQVVVGGGPASLDHLARQRRWHGDRGRRQVIVSGEIEQPDAFFVQRRGQGMGDLVFTMLADRA